MSLRFHEISESRHRIMNPLTHDKLMLIGEICEPTPETRQLDLACGQGEMLCQWSRAYGQGGVGVDISPVFLAGARRRAEELGVSSRLEFVQQDAAAYVRDARGFDLVSCIGATWIGGGTIGTIDLMRPALKDRKKGLLLLGEVFWRNQPDAETCVKLGFQPDELTDLAGLPARFAQAGTRLVEMVLANEDSWDRYSTRQWQTGCRWLEDHPDDPEAAAYKKWLDDAQAQYLKYERQYLGWGVFVLKVID